MGKLNKILLIFSGISSLSILALHGYLGSYTRLLADDYCSVVYAKEFGFVDSILYWYKSWSGRYSAFGIDWVVLNVFDAYHIGWIPPLILLTWLVVTTSTTLLFLRSIRTYQENFLHALVLSSLALSLTLLLSPNIPQSLYWWNGMRSYTLPLLVLTLGALFYIGFKPFLKTKLLIILGAAFIFGLSFANGGLGEAYAVIQLALFAVLIFIRFLSFRKIKPDVINTFLFSDFNGTLTSVAFILHSYGNVIRRSQLSPAPDPITLAQISVESYTIFIGRTFSNIENFLALFGAMILVILIGLRYKKKERIPSWKIGFYFLSGILLSFAAFPPGVYGYSKYPPDRVLSLSAFMLVVFFLYACFLTGNWLAQTTNPNTVWTIPSTLIAALFIIGSAVPTGISLHQSRIEYISFAKKWDQIDSQILQAKAEGKNSITIPAMENWAGLLRPNNNPNFWVTECYSLYYGIEVLGPPYEW